MYIVPNTFCYWDCKSQLATRIIMFNMVITLILFFYILYAYIRSKRFLKKGISKFYIILMSWAVSKYRIIKLILEKIYLERLHILPHINIIMVMII